MELKKKPCGKAETVREFTYLVDRVSSVGGNEAAVNTRTRCGWVKLRECDEMIHGRFPLKHNGAVNRSCVRPALLYGSEAWCLKKMRWKFSETQIDQWEEECVEHSSK